MLRTADKTLFIRGVSACSPRVSATGYRKPILVAFRGGTAAEMVTGITSGFGGMGRPTQTSIDLMSNLKAFLDPLLARMKEITDKDIPELNNFLASNGISYIR
jgi:hypothetical protein